MQIKSFFFFYEYSYLMNIFLGKRDVCKSLTSKNSAATLKSLETTITSILLYQLQVINFWRNTDYMLYTYFYIYVDEIITCDNVVIET